MQTLMDVLLYLFYVLIDGDWHNDWLNHAPEAMRMGLAMIGQLLSVLVGY
jgi:hypothetical protein